MCLIFEILFIQASFKPEICTQINHVVYVYLGINDTKTKQISNSVNKSFISITYVFNL